MARVLACDQADEGQLLAATELAKAQLELCEFGRFAPN